MNTKELKEVLLLVGSVYIQNWGILRKIVDSISNGDAEVIKSFWADNFKSKYLEHYPLRLEDINTWSTYSRCFHLTFTVVNNKLNCYAVVYDGDSFNGSPTKVRFEASINLNDKFIKEIYSEIGYKFNRMMLDKYDEYLSNKKREWIENESLIILKGKKF